MQTIDLDIVLNIDFRSCHPELFLVKGVLKICSKLTEEHPCRSLISIKLQSNFIEIPLRYGCSPVNWLHVFRTSFTKNTSGWLLLWFEYWKFDYWHQVFKYSFRTSIWKAVFRMEIQHPFFRSIWNEAFQFVCLFVLFLFSGFFGVFLLLFKFFWRKNFISFQNSL